MKPKDIFSLAVRLLGLVFLYLGLQALPPAIAQILGSFPHQLGGGYSQPGSFTGFVTGVVMAGWPLCLAYWLVGGASFLMRTAYPDAEAKPTDETKVGGEVSPKAEV